MKTTRILPQRVDQFKTSLLMTLVRQCREHLDEDFRLSTCLKPEYSRFWPVAVQLLKSPPYIPAIEPEMEAARQLLAQELLRLSHAAAP